MRPAIRTNAIEIGKQISIGPRASRPPPLPPPLAGEGRVGARRPPCERAGKTPAVAA